MCDCAVQVVMCHGMSHRVCHGMSHTRKGGELCNGPELRPRYDIRRADERSPLVGAGNGNGPLVMKDTPN